MPENLFAPGERIERINVAEEIRNSFLDYSMSVIISRALPDVRDGLKPSQRRILLRHAANSGSAAGTRRPRKCAKHRAAKRSEKVSSRTARQVDLPDALSTWREPWSMRERLIEGKGNFGSVEGDRARRHALHRGAADASRRHFDGGLSAKETVDFTSLNYDETRRTWSRSCFPAAFPNLAGQRRHRHRGRHGDESRPAQSRRGHRRPSVRDHRQAGHYRSRS